MTFEQAVQTARKIQADYDRLELLAIGKFGRVDDWGCSVRIDKREQAFTVVWDDKDLEQLKEKPRVLGFAAACVQGSLF